MRGFFLFNLLVSQKVYYLLAEIFGKTDGVGNHVLQIVKFAVTKGGSVVNLNKNDFKRAVEPVKFNKVVFLIILIVNQKHVVFIDKILVINFFNQADGLSAAVTRLIVEKDINNRLVIIGSGFREVFLRDLIGHVAVSIFYLGRCRGSKKKSQKKQWQNPHG